MSLTHEMRKDPILERWIIVTKTSPASLSDYIVKKEEADDPLTCPLCVGKEGNTPPEIIAIREPGSTANSPGWFTRVIPHFKPLLQVEGDLNRQGVGMYDKINGIGASELIIESPEHSIGAGEMSVEQAIKVFLTYKERILDLENDSRLRYVLISKNYGKAAGALYSHPHSQLIASPIIPKRIKEELDGARLYYNLKERCVFCDIIREERTAERIILENMGFVAFCPFASAFPFETWIVPKKHNCAFQDTDRRELEDVGITVITIMKKLKKLLDDPPYNLILHTAPNRIPRREHWHTLGDDFHWHIEIVPRLINAGFEWSSGFYVLTIPPEEGAKYLREA